MVNYIHGVRHTLVVFAKVFWWNRCVTDQWSRLAYIVAKRRRELGLSQDAIRRAGGPSDVVLSRIEADEEPRPRDDTINKLDKPLQWEPGSARSVLAGGDAVPVGRYVNLREVDLDALLSELRRRVLSPGEQSAVPGSFADLYPQWGHDPQPRGDVGDAGAS